MRIHLYALCWNDAPMLGFFFAHYDRFVAKYTLFDDGSTDASLDLLRRHPRVEIHPLPPELAALGAVDRALRIWQSCWKRSRGQADWVIVTEIDEHLDHPDLPGYLERCARQGISIVPALGYQMLSHEFPAPGELLCATRTLGAPWDRMSKLSVFAPDAIEEIGYAPGRHRADPSGRVLAPARDEVVNRHYKYLGVDHVLRRNRELAKRLSAANVAAGQGHRWLWDRQRLMLDWAEFESRLVDLAAPDYEPATRHQEPRWWSGLPRAAAAASVATRSAWGTEVQS